MVSFVHLHVHSEYSLLDGLAKLPDLCTRAAETGMQALALTDHGSMYGTIKFSHAAEAAGIKPLYGCELYEAPRARYDKEAQDRRPYHLVLIAENQIGYKNLLKLVSLANLEGFYYKPRIDRELLQQYSEGLICLSACLAGRLSRLVAENRMDDAREAVTWYLDTFGRGNFFIEVQRHAGIPEQEPVNQKLFQLAQEFDVPCVATADVHYAHREDAKAQELLLAIQTQTTINDPNRMRMGGDDFYLLSPEEMNDLWPDHPEVLANTNLIAERCNVSVGFTEYHLPKVDVPEGYTAEEYLRKKAYEGLAWRYGQVTPELEQRMDYELGIIHGMGFDDYFLINMDLMDWAKNRAKMLIGPGRGSASNSIVSYSLNITDLDPIANGLLFERFLNPGRITMPDIDLDYPEDRRQEVIDYLSQRYGQDKTAQIATFGTLAPRMAIRDVGRAMGIGIAEVDHIAKMVPSGPKVHISDALNVPELKAEYDTIPWVHELIDYCAKVEGVSRHLSTHAAGVLITDVPLVEYCSVQQAPRGEGIISQYCMSDVEEIGLLKLDVLGLSTLTILDRTFRWIKRTAGEEVNQHSIPLDDPDTYALLSRGETVGVFQLESGGMTRTVKEMQPTEFSDIVALLALYRPGPMEFIPNYIARKYGRESVEYRHPSLEPLLKETYGIIVYQEQIIKIASELAGYSLSEADLMRRAVGKKKLKALEEQHSQFVTGTIHNGIPKEAAEAIFADIEKFANYGFPKGHAAGYAVITLQTAYLKAHYPAQFLTGMLSVERGNADKVALFINECKRMGIAVRPPDINLSEVDFSLEPLNINNGQHVSEQILAAADTYAIRYGLGGIKNVGDGPAGTIVEARGDQPFESIGDFVERVDLRQVNKRVLECLVRAGAFDSLGNRSAILADIDKIVGESQRIHRNKEIGQRSLFDLAPASGNAELSTFTLSANVPDLSRRQRLQDEKELLGVYMSAHPLDGVRTQDGENMNNSADIDETMKGNKVRLVGLLSAIRTITTKKNTRMAFAQLEDMTGIIELTFFPRTYESCKDELTEESVVVLEGKVDVRNEKCQIIVDTLSKYEATRPGNGKSSANRLTLRVPLSSRNNSEVQLIDHLVHLFENNAGAVPVELTFESTEGAVKMQMNSGGVNLTDLLTGELVRLIGRDNFSIA